MKVIHLLGAAALLLSLPALCEATELRSETLIPAKRGLVTFGLPYHALGPRATVSASVTRSVQQSEPPPVNSELNQIGAPAAPHGGAGAPASPGLSPSPPAPPSVPNVTLTPPTPATPALPGPGAPAPSGPTP